MDSIHPSTELAVIRPKAPPLLSERTDFLEGDAPAASKVEAFQSQALAASGNAGPATGALVPWICDALLSNHSIKAYGRDLANLVRHLQSQCAHWTLFAWKRRDFGSQSDTFTPEVFSHEYANETL